MIIEIAGVGTANKGAELMLVAAREHFAPKNGAVRLAVDSWFGPYEARAQYGLQTKLRATKFGRSSIAIRLMPKSFRQAYGLVAEEDVAAVLDASGFAFSDQLGAERTEAFAEDVLRWKRQGKKVVLLPQAFGPFEQGRVREAFAKVVEAADVLYARDPVSFEWVKKVGAGEGKVRLSPDFTACVRGELPQGFEAKAGRVCVVPNYRMVEKTGEAEKGRYLPFLAMCVECVRGMGLEPVLLLHDAKADEPLVTPLQKELKQPVEVIREGDPKKLKGILGTMTAVIGSRFHALVSSLSQGVPCLATGWSHKYAALFNDYGCGESVITVDSTAEEVREKLGPMVGEPGRADLVGRLKAAAAVQKEKIARMWDDVDGVLALR